MTQRRVVGYTVHTWEMATLRGWALTFLAATAARLGEPGWMPSPAILFTAADLAGVAISVTGNETAQSYGRGRVVLWAMTAAAALSLATGWTTGGSVVLAAAVLLWNISISLASSALTARTVQAQDKHLRGATMRLHSMARYAGGFLGPLGVGWFLDLAGGHGMLGWGLAFGHLAMVTLTGLFILRRLGRERC